MEYGDFDGNDFQNWKEYPEGIRYFEYTDE